IRPDVGDRRVLTAVVGVRDVVRDTPGLVDGVRPVLDADEASLFRMPPARDVAGRVDVAGTGCATELVADEPILDEQPGGVEPTVVWERADADDSCIRLHRAPIGEAESQCSCGALDSLDAVAEPELDPVPGRELGEQERGRAPDDAL